MSKKEHIDGELMIPVTIEAWSVRVAPGIIDERVATKDAPVVVVIVDPLVVGVAPKRTEARLAHATLTDFLKAVEILSANALLGSVVQRAVNRGKRKRSDPTGITPGKMMLSAFRAYTSKTTTFNAGTPDEIESDRAWRSLGRTEPLGADEAYELVGGMYGISGEAVKKIIRKLR